MVPRHHQATGLVSYKDDDVTSFSTCLLNRFHLQQIDAGEAAVSVVSGQPVCRVAEAASVTQEAESK